MGIFTREQKSPLNDKDYLFHGVSISLFEVPYEMLVRYWIFNFKVEFTLSHLMMTVCKKRGICPRIDNKTRLISEN